MTIRNIFLDMGDTLVHRPIDRQVGYAMLLRQFGYNVSDQDMLAAYDKARAAIPQKPKYKQTMEEINQHFMQRLITSIQNLGLEPAGEIAMRLASSNFNSIELFPDAEPFLKQAKSLGYRLGVISNWDPELISFCKKIGIHGYLDTIVASRALGYQKPLPEIFHCALASIGASPEESVHIGDSVGADALGAMWVGMHPIVLDREGVLAGLFCPVIRLLNEVIPTVRSL